MDAVDADVVSGLSGGEEKEETSGNTVSHADRANAAEKNTKGDDAAEQPADTVSLTDNAEWSSEGSNEDCGSDSDNTSEGSCLEAMDHYLRLGHTPRRRSALRLSRIITRQLLLRRLARSSQGKSLYESFNGGSDFEVLRSNGES